MKLLLLELTAAVAALAIAAPVIAADKAGEPASACVTEAKALKGEEREKALALCEKHASAGSQQNKMKSCNVEAKKKDLHGDERRAFMSSCLKG